MCVCNSTCMYSRHQGRSLHLGSRRRRSYGNLLEIRSDSYRVPIQKPPCIMYMDIMYVYICMYIYLYMYVYININIYIYIYI